MKNTVLFLLLPLWLASCERRELTFYTEAEITVTADWSRADQQEENQYGATLIFYPQDGGTPRVVLMGDRTPARWTLRRHTIQPFVRRVRHNGIPGTGATAHPRSLRPANGDALRNENHHRGARQAGLCRDTRL